MKLQDPCNDICWTVHTFAPLRGGYWRVWPWMGAGGSGPCSSAVGWGGQTSLSRVPTATCCHSALLRAVALLSQKGPCNHSLNRFVLIYQFISVKYFFLMSKAQFLLLCSSHSLYPNAVCKYRICIMKGIYENQLHSVQVTPWLHYLWM